MHQSLVRPLILLLVVAFAPRAFSDDARSSTTLPFRDYLYWLELDPPDDAALRWDAHNHQLLYSSSADQFFFYLSGSVSPGSALRFQQKTVPLGPDGAFRIKVDALFPFE